MKVLVIPIKPVFAYRIFTGKKRYDLRKLVRRVDIRVGSRVVVYVSGRVKAFMGEYTVGRVVQGPPDYIIKVLSEDPDAGVGEEDYSYIRGAKQAVAMEVVNPIVYKKPVELKPVLHLFPDYQPPLGIQELDAHEPVVVLVFDRARRMSLGS
ncbi:MAG: DNA-binding protein [Desulfurococcaceae archaeon]